MIIVGDSFEKLATLESNSVQCCVTSPPYWGLRDYGVDGQLGLEKTPEQYVGSMRLIFEQVRRVLKDDGTLWLNLGDSYAAGGSGGVSDKSKLNGGKGVGPNEKLMHMQAKSFSRKPPQGLKHKDLCGIPWRVAFALQADGWYLRQDIIWHKPNPMPESVTDRCTKAHEYIFLLSKRPKYYFDITAIKEPAVCGAKGSEFHIGKTGEHQLGRSSKNRPAGNKARTFDHTPKPGVGAGVPWDGSSGTRQKRSVWSVTPKPFKGAHFATFPPDLIEPCILAGSKPGDTILDPFFGAGTTGLVAKKHGRNYVGIELNPEYAAMAEARINPKEQTA